MRDIHSDLKRRKKLGAVLLSLSLLVPLFSSCAPATDPVVPGEEGAQIDELAEHTLTFAVSPPEAAYLSGISVQTLLEGERSTTVEAIPLPGYSFVSWSDGKKDTVRRNISIDEDTTLTALFEENYESCPELSLDISIGRDVFNKIRPVPCTLSVGNIEKRYQRDALEGMVRGRGNASWNWEKKSYVIKLTESQKLCGLGDGKSSNWILISNHCDQSLLRNYMAFWLQKHLDGIDWSPSCRLVDLTLNGTYHGNYLLIEKVSVNKDKIAIETAEETGKANAPFLVELDNYAHESGENGVEWFTVKGVPYRIREDNPTKARCAYIDSVLTSIYETVMEGNKSDVSALIDVDSAVDAYLLEEISKNIDCGWSSFYLYMGEEGKLHFGPCWDFDLAFGNDYRLDNGSYKLLYAGRENGFDQQNPWFLRLMEHEWFQELAKSRFLSLMEEGLFDEMIGEIDRMWQSCGDSITRNFERWPIFGARINMEPEQVMALDSAKAHVEYLKKWLQNRIEWLAENWL